MPYCYIKKYVFAFCLVILVFLSACSTNKTSVRCPEVGVLFDGYEIWRYSEANPSISNFKYHAQLEFGGAECHLSEDASILHYTLPVYVIIEKGPAFDKQEEQIAFTSTITQGDNIITTTKETAIVNANNSNNFQIVYPLSVAITIKEKTSISDYKQVLSLYLSEEEIINIRDKGHNINPLK